jgi:hypothetical protein
LTVTTTLAAPGTPGGVVAVIDVEPTRTTFVAATPANVTVAPAAKFVPVIVTVVPPAVEPTLGVTRVTLGVAGARYVYPPVSVPASNPGLVTTTSTAPAAVAGGVVAVIVVEFTTVAVAALPPKVTVAPVAKFVPPIVTEVPPACGPLFGATDVTVGCTTT